jgi:hypothetical protein
MHRIIGRVQIKDDLLRSLLLRSDERGDHESVDLQCSNGNPLVAIRLRRINLGKLQSVESALASKRFPHISRPRPVPAQWILRSHHDGEQWILPQLIVIGQILVAQRNSEDPLRQELLN